MADVGIAERLEGVRERVAAAAVRSGRTADAVTLIGVSKTANRHLVDAAYAAGLRHFGENRVQDALAKFELDRPADLTLHLIGHLQTNKARDAVRGFQFIHSVDSDHLIEALSRQAVRVNKLVPILLEVNVSGEASKQGLAPAAVEAAAAVAAANPGVELRGLMTMAPLVDDAEATRPVFRALRELRDNLAKRHPQWALAELSMGMTNDFEVAIEEGATMVRVGRAIFGA